MMIPDMMPAVFMLLIWLAMMTAMIGGYVCLLIAVWRAMKAHESIAASMREIALQKGRQ